MGDVPCCKETIVGKLLIEPKSKLLQVLNVVSLLIKSMKLNVFNLFYIVFVC